MPLSGEYEPGTYERARDQADLYESSGGTEGTTIYGYPCVLLTTRGRRSGKLRRSPLIRVERDGLLLAVASMGGAPKHPMWYLNVLADPEVMVRDGRDVFDARARPLEGDEREDWWNHAVATFPNYAEYQTKTERQIPAVLLEPR